MPDSSIPYEYAHASNVWQRIDPYGGGGTRFTTTGEVPPVLVEVQVRHRTDHWAKGCSCRGVVDEEPAGKVFRIEHGT